MKERERILELVQKGIISTEEALILLESNATEKGEKLVEKEADKVKQTTKTAFSKSQRNNEDQAEVSSSLNEKTTDNMSEKYATEEDSYVNNQEEILEELVAKVTQLSSKLDQINVEIMDLESLVKDKQEQISILDTLEEFEQAEVTEEKKLEQENLKNELITLEVELEKLVANRRHLEKQLNELKKQQKSENWTNFSSKFEIPEDWKDTASDRLQDVGEKMNELGTNFGKFMRETISSVTNAINENVDWKEVNFKVPGIATTKLEHEFYYPDNKASLLNIKVANGNVQVKTWDKEDIKILAKIKLYGKMEAETPFEAFLERSIIEIDDETISFQVPNKRIKIDLEFYLPKRSYDHVSVKLLNGNILLKDIETKDVYTKTTIGEMEFDGLKSTMLEVDGVNGDIKVVNSEVLDLLIEAINGEIKLHSLIQNSRIKLVNGVIKMTTEDERVNKIEANVINGSIKLALPSTIGLEGDLKTKLGNIQSRLSNFEVVREKKTKTGQDMQIRRYSTDQTVHLKLETTTGSILMKDSTHDKE